ncbi:MAG: PilZ domain-containing protein [Polyangiales bacterium]
MATISRERRLATRVKCDGEAMLFERGEAIGRYRVTSISANGAWLIGALRIRRGQLVHVCLAMPNVSSPLSVSAAVRRVHHSSEESGVALSFPTLHPDQEDALQDLWMKALAEEKASARASVLVYEPRARVRAELEREIRALGCDVVAFSELQAAVAALEDDDATFESLVLHTAAAEAATVDVVEFFAREGLHTVLIPNRRDNDSSSAVRRLSSIPCVDVPPNWTRESLRAVLK